MSSVPGSLPGLRAAGLAFPVAREDRPRSDPGEVRGLRSAAHGPGTGLTPEVQTIPGKSAGDTSVSEAGERDGRHGAGRRRGCRGRRWTERQATTVLALMMTAALYGVEMADASPRDIKSLEPATTRALWGKRGPAEQRRCCTQSCSRGIAVPPA